MTKIGRSARKLFPTIKPGDLLKKYFVINRPKVSFSFKAILLHQDSVFVLNHIDNTNLNIKGQMVHLEEEDVILFSFTPVVRDVSFFSGYGITLNDFPFYDTTIELLFALQASQKALDEAKSLSKRFEEKVIERTFELKLKNDEIQAQNEEYIQQQEQLNKQSLFLEEKNRRIQKARELIHTKNRQLKKHSVNLEKEVQQRTQELTSMNNELLSQNSQLEQFAFIVAHNLRAPIARILGLINLMKLESLVDSSNEFYVENIHLATLRLEEVIRDLNIILDIRKGLHQSFKMVSLSEKTSKVLETLKTQVEDSKAKIVIDYSQVDTIFSISSYLENVLYNLISNSLKYRDTNRQLELLITSTRTADDVCLMVKDNGIGFDLKKNKDNLFKLYKRFHDHVEGKGLGLYMIKTQVEAIGGRIEIESAKGKGSTFFVYFNRAQPGS